MSDIRIYRQLTISTQSPDCRQSARRLRLRLREIAFGQLVQNLTDSGINLLVRLAIKNRTEQDGMRGTKG